MLNRDHNHAMPNSWLQVVGFIVVLWAAASDAMAQVGDVLVTEVRGTVVRASKNSVQPVRALQSIKVGERIRLSSDSQVTLFLSEDARLYVLDGPAEISVGPKAILSNGKAAPSKKLDDAFRGVKIDSGELVQGSLVMRSFQPVSLVSPEGAVALLEARTFRWKGAGGPVRFELATDAGDLVHRANVTSDVVTLPQSITLTAGTKYVWGILRDGDASTVADWTEFVVMERGGLKPSETASRSERVVYAAWLQQNQLPRAAVRALPSSSTR